LQITGAFVTNYNSKFGILFLKLTLTQWFELTKWIPVVLAKAACSTKRDLSIKQVQTFCIDCFILIKVYLCLWKVLFYTFALLLWVRCYAQKWNGIFVNVQIKGIHPATL